VPGIHNPLYIEFIAQLRRARRAKGLTQETLGALLKKPQAFVSKVETCERRLDVIEAAQWCVVLEIQLKEVLPAELRRVLSEPADKPSTIRRRR
jgi:transcriptional regulator with XRE-family HTH domain